MPSCFRFSSTFLSVAVAILVGSAASLRAGPQVGYWGGGSGAWDTTTAHWNTDGSSSGPFTSTFGVSGQAYFGGAGTAGVVTLGTNLPIADLYVGQTGYTFALSGYSLSLSHYIETTGTTTFDFDGGSSSLSVVDAGPGSISFGPVWQISNYVVGSDVLQLRYNASSLLTVSDLSHITFVGYTLGGAAQTDSNGFITPEGILAAVPETSTYAALIGAATLSFAVWQRRRAPHPISEAE